jgi:hypothetical protein
MKPNTARKLTLARETVRLLDAAALTGAIGGYTTNPPTNSNAGSCFGPTCAEFGCKYAL